jgi:hypothetical protein
MDMTKEHIELLLKRLKPDSPLNQEKILAYQAHLAKPEPCE